MLFSEVAFAVELEVLFVFVEELLLELLVPLDVVFVDELLLVEFEGEVVLLTFVVEFEGVEVVLLLFVVVLGTEEFVELLLLLLVFVDGVEEVAAFFAFSNVCEAWSIAAVRDVNSWIKVKVPIKRKDPTRQRIKNVL